ncbi:MAG: DUF4406 domain-containing protein [Oscillospiraceae bacterium]|nr:DUF4406 domain-containing protein [Oscillospiraceae bacterium]
MKVVYVCSPLRGDVERNSQNARYYCQMSAGMGVVPLAPHAIFTQYLDDRKPEQREQGLAMGLELLLKCDELWWFGSVVSEGMAAEIKLAKQSGIPIHQVIDPDDPLCYPACPQNVAEIVTLYSG